MTEEDVVKMAVSAFSCVEPSNIGEGRDGVDVFASFSAPEKVRVVANEKNTLLFCKLICIIEKNCLTLHRQIETGI